MQSCSGIPKVWVGVVLLMAIVWMLPRVEVYSNCGFPSGPGLKLLLSCPSQTVDKGLGSAIDMSLQDIDGMAACGLPAPHKPLK